MSSLFRLVPVKERSHSHEADLIGGLLAENRAWIGAFIVLLDGMNFKSVPSMTIGATVFEAATKRDSRARALLQALDSVYAAVRDGYDAGHIRGEILERYVLHVMSKPFPLRVGACAVECDGEFVSEFRLDAATNSECPAVAVEAKTSERALVGRRSADLPKFAAKAQWVVGLHQSTSGSILAVFVTWAPEVRFRKALVRLVGEEAAKAAYIYGHEQVGQLPSRISALLGRLGVPANS